MPEQRILIVVDMQNGVFATPRINRERCVANINQLIRCADTVIFIQHSDIELKQGSPEFAILPELIQPDNTLYVIKTACDAFYRTDLAQTLNHLQVTAFVICGCATDYCLDTTIKIAASRGFALTVAADGHSMANRAVVDGQTLIDHYNEVWRNLIIPDNPITVKNTADILNAW